MQFRNYCETQKHVQTDILLFSKTTGLEEIFHVKQLQPQNLDDNKKGKKLVTSTDKEKKKTKKTTQLLCET